MFVVLKTFAYLCEQKGERHSVKTEFTMKYEFYIFDGELFAKGSDGNDKLVDFSMIDFLDKVLDKVKESYPLAYEALKERYKRSAPNKIYYKYIMAKRFIKCNFARLDSTFIDIDEVSGELRMNFERSECLLRDECKFDGVICSPLFNTRLSAKEMSVAKLWYDGLSKEEIGGMLFLSVETINNHIRNIYGKIGVHDKAEFVKYVDKNKIFK